MKSEISFDWIEDKLICCVFKQFTTECRRKIIQYKPNAIHLFYCDWPNDLKFINDLPISHIKIDHPDRVRSLPRITSIHIGDMPHGISINNSIKKIAMTATNGVYPADWGSLERLEIWDVKKCKELNLEKLNKLRTLIIKGGRNSLEYIALNGNSVMDQLLIHNCHALKSVSVSNVRSIDFIEIGGKNQVDLRFLDGLMIKSLIIHNRGDVKIRTNGIPLHCGGRNTRYRVCS